MKHTFERLCGAWPGCAAESSDQARALEWALGDAALAAHVDAAPGTAVVGHSMGGGATIGSCSRGPQSHSDAAQMYVSLVIRHANYAT